MAKTKIFLTILAAGFSLLASAQEAGMPAFRYAQAEKKVIFDRDELFEQSKLPPAVALPVVPRSVIALPKNWPEINEPVSILLAQLPKDKLLVRRVGNNDGQLYLEIYCPEGKISGTAEVKMGKKTLGKTDLNGSLWLSLKPKIGRIEINVLASGENIQLTVPTTLVEVIERRIFLNGEPYLMKGATGSPANGEIADYVRTIGFNTLRASTECEKYGFMGIISLNSINAPKEVFDAADDVFERESKKYLDRIGNNSVSAINNPNALILQLGNERSFNSNPPGVDPVNTVRRRVGQMLVEARNRIKPACPMLPVGYANHDLSFLTPDCFDVYMHNSYYDKDRYEYPWESFMKWQGCLPPYGPDGKGRPFVNSEYGANRYLCQSYLAGPNNPVLEKIHAWNLSELWNVFMKNGTVGGTIYRFDDNSKPIDQGCSRFGILTDDQKVKLACWEVGQMWRDFTVETDGKKLLVTFRRDYHARDCRLTITPVNGEPVQVTLKDFSPHSSRSISLKSLNPDDGYRWRMDFTTHSGLASAAAGAQPVKLEEEDFLSLIRERNTAPFLTELFDTEVLTVTGNPAPPTLFEMTDSQGVIPVILRKRNGTAYLVIISREDPNTGAGQIKEGLTLDITFKGKVERVDDMTGQPLPDIIDAAPVANGLRLTNIKAARIPGPIGQRSAVPFMMPVYRITP
ncbi:MAG: hypothetical protein LBL04_04895 [Bacteroidales bacterium]|jgi:hypothetical protein|nr:hypothetical protein [Bacteroidales bacterium]